MSINPINHWALTGFASVHDEEALTALELQARTVAKVNECIEIINKQLGIINAELDKVEEYALEGVENSITDGRISTRLNQMMWDNLQTTYAQLDQRIDNLVLNASAVDADNPELVDARRGHTQTHDTLGSHVRALGNGSAFSDAVRPGTVKAGRIMAGMTGGELRDKYTVREVIPMAGHWVGANGYYDADTLELQMHSGYKTSTPIPCEYGDTFLLTSYLFGPKVKPAVLFNAQLQCVGVLGTPGASTWDPINDEVHVNRGDVAYIAFTCGSSQLSDFRAMRVAMKDAPDRDATGGAKGYIHVRAKKRTDTITDRAQLKVWFPLPEDRTGNEWCSIPLQLLRYTNLGGWTYRLFGATSGDTYDEQLLNSAAAYTFPTSQGIRPTFLVPLTTAEGTPITHLCLFIDLIPAREDEYINAYFTPLRMDIQGGSSSQGTGYALHGHLDTDTLNLVGPGAAASPLYGKRVLGIGDSLMSGNTLRKEKSWFNLAAGARDALHYNAAVNGRPVAGADSMASNLDAILDAFPNPDYLVIQGGANDLRLGVSIDAFRAGLESIVSTVRAAYPRCKILLATNWSRSEYVNALGNTESDYVDAMLEVAENIRLPVVNNWTTGLDLRDAAVQAWADEGLVTTGTANIHFSEAANEYIAPVYINALEGI